MTVQTASSTRSGDYTQVKRCDGCGRAFWAKSTWSRVQVKCPHCAHIH